MHDFLVALGLQKFDFALLILCPIRAILGSFAHAILQVIDPHRIPRPGTVRIASTLDAFGRLAWLLFRLGLGGILGIVVGLYFVGALQENITTLAKIIALSVHLGFAAPKLWLAHERVVTDQINKKVDEILGGGSSKT